MVDSGKFENEWYIYHIVVGEDILLLSDKHVLLVSSHGASLNSKWNFLLKSIGKVDKGSDFLTFYLRSGRKYVVESIDPTALNTIHQAVLEQVVSIDKRITIWN